MTDDKHRDAQRPGHDATYLRGWNEGIERAIEQLEKEGWYTPQETIRRLLEPALAPQPALEPTEPRFFIDHGMIHAYPVNAHKR